MLQGLVVFSIDGEKQSLDLRGGKGKTYKGMPENGEKPDLTLTISDDNFVKLVMGKLGPQQVRHHCIIKPEEQGIPAGFCADPSSSGDHLRTRTSLRV